MGILRIAVLTCCISAFTLLKLFSQTVSCPTNIDFELGNFTNWRLYTGTCCAINTPTLSGAVANRHVITSGTANDPYGGFPIVSPGSGSYSLKLGNNSVGAQAERARYHVKVPAGINDYSLIFRYAVVFQDPSHTTPQQPRFEVKAYDSATNAIVNCSQFTYVATSNLPGFTLSSSGSNVWYRNWSTASIDLSGYAGRTVIVDFATGDCALGGHFGYGYVDLDCGLFKINTVACVNSPTTTLTAPPGFQSYVWTDSNLTTTIATGQTATIPTPSATTKYAVILTPYTGYGCPDTLFTTVTVQNININGRTDTSICLGDSVALTNNVTGDGMPFTYSWSPSSSLSCSTCITPIAKPSTDTRYILTVSNSNGCIKRDTISINVSNLSLDISKQNISCFGAANGSVTALPTNGQTPYIYQWSTTPVQTTQTITGLNTGIYTVKVTDNLGCSRTKSDTITQPVVLTTLKSQFNINCFGDNTGYAKVNAAGGTPPYSYSWNTTPIRTTDSIYNLVAGTYIVTTTDSKGCIKTDTFIINQPTMLATAINKTDVTCYALNNGRAIVTATGGISPYTYSWNTTPVQTNDTITNLSAGTYIAIVTDNNGCIERDTVIINQPLQLSTGYTQTNINCNGGNNGTITLTANGGTIPYSYNWNTSPVQNTPTISNLSAGIYVNITTDGNGCIKRDTVHITEPQLLTSLKSGRNISCFGSANGMARITLSGGTLPYTYSWNTSPVQTNDSITGLIQGTYIVVSTDNKGCSLTDTFIITEPTALTTIVNKTDVSCFDGTDGSISLVASGGTTPYSYNWNTNPVRTTTTINTLPDGTYISVTTDNNGCVKTDTVIITEPTPIAATITKQNISCNGGNNGNISLSVTGGTAPYIINWNTTPAQSGTTLTDLIAGTYIATITDAKGCTRKDTIVLTQPAVLTSNALSTNVSCFGGNNGTANVITTGGTLPYTYSWNTNPARTTAGITVLTSGTYVVTVTDSLLCTAKDTVIIIQPTAIVNTKSKNDVSCFNGNNGNATVIVSGGIPSYTYSWNTSPVQTGATASNLTNGTYIVTIRDTNNCIKYDTVTILQPTQLQTVLSKTDVRCYADTNGNATIVAAGATPPYTYNWSNGNTTSGINNLSSGVYKVTVTDSKGCIKEDSAILLQPYPLSNTFSKNDVNCYNGSDAIVASNINGGNTPYNYNWSSGQTTSTLNGVKAGKYTLTVTDDKGCTYIDSINITEPLPLITTAKDNGKICVGYTTGAVNTITTGGTTPYNYSWNTIPVQTSANAGSLPAGTYIVTVTDNNGCTTQDTATIDNHPKVDITVSPDEKICLGKTAYLNVSGAKKYFWTPSGSLSCSTCNSPAAKPIESTDYTVVGIDTNQCTDTATVRITVIPRLDVSVGPEINICEGDEAKLNADGGIEYEWTPPVFLDNNLTSSPNSRPDSSIRYRVIITENECFKDTLYQNVVVHRKPFVELGPNLKGVPGASIRLKADVENSNTIKWTPMEGLSCYDCFDPTAYLSKTITYTATVYTDYCEAKDDITIHVACDGALFFIPNTFTPNGDGSNDRFYPSASGITNIDVFRVYNRWGEKVFEARDMSPNKPESGWDGTYKGKPEWPDVFVYFLESRCGNGEKIFLKGDISLIR